MTIKQLNLKNRTYYFYNDLINTNNFDHNNLRLDKQSVFNNDVYYIGHITKNVTSISKNVYTDKLDDIVHKYNN